MATTLSMKKVASALTRGLKLKNPRFVLERHGPWISGSVISETFKRKGDLKRQRMILAALEAELGADAANRHVGMLLAYTPEEWDMDLEWAPAPGRKAG